ncbi:MAG: zinc metallopeptidase [Patescibacteria group bacterium]|nr:zinc metallopeptidase [Patescibacteria group bacterium]
MFYDPTMLLLIPALLLSLYAQFKVKMTYARFSKVRSRKGLTGAQAANYILRNKGLGSIPIEETPGSLTDHYDPRKKILRLSSDNYHSDSIAALGVSAHEAGHAVQHGEGYAPLAFRNTIVPVANFGSTLAFPLFILGIIFSWSSLIDLGIILFSVAVVFTVITLPVEFNASRRAIAELANSGFLQSDELQGAKKVLNAAALTYVAATAMAVLELVRLLLIRNSMDES